MEDNPAKSDTPGQTLLVSYLTIRKAVGLLGMLLPLVLWLGVKLLTKCDFIQDSISDYYYSKMGHYLVGTLCAVALFLFAYNGYDKKDLIAGKLACCFALGVAFFPTTNMQPLSDCKVFAIEGKNFINIIHFTTATLFFITLAYFSYFLFTKSGGHPTNRKRQRNIVYKTCGIIIIGCIILLTIYSVVPSIQEKLHTYKPIFWLEALALEAFGLSWLTKGEALLADKE
jgi:hypothetical protein